jgi:hypothetical protein
MERANMEILNLARQKDESLRKAEKLSVTVDKIAEEI